MKESKQATFDSGLILEAIFTDGVLSGLYIIADGNKEVKPEDVPGLISWLQNTVKSTNNAPVAPQQPLPAAQQAIAERTVNKPSMPGVEFYDYSDRLKNPETVKFTIPKKNG